MKVLIVEDEKLAAERLHTLLKEYDPSIEVLGSLESIEESVNYIRQKPAPDLILLDIHLSDGQSFEIFKRVNYQKPVIFTTAYDQYALDAFKMVSIDYILKPVTLEALSTAINKFHTLINHSVSIDLSKLPNLPKNDFKKRFLGKVGQRLFFIDAVDIAYFQADNKIVHLVDKEGNRYLVDHTMDKLEQLLDTQEFFRLNRKYIVRINAIQQVKPYYNNRMKISLKGCNLPEEDMVISRDRIADFKSWADC